MLETKEIIYKDISPYYKNNENVGYNTITNEQAIRNSLRNLFLISLGEVPGKPWMGNPLNTKLFENIDPFLEHAIKNAFINTVENFEPRVLIEDVIVDIQYGNLIRVELKYYNLIDEKDVLRVFRFSTNYNTITNLSLREPV